MQGCNQIDEVGLGAAVATRPEEVKHAHAAWTLAGEGHFPKTLMGRLKRNATARIRPPFALTVNGGRPSMAG